MSLQVGLSIPAFPLALGDGRLGVVSPARLVCWPAIRVQPRWKTESTNPVRDRTERKMILYCVMFEGNYCNFMTDHIHKIQRILRNT